MRRRLTLAAVLAAFCLGLLTAGPTEAAEGDEQIVGLVLSGPGNPAGDVVLAESVQPPGRVRDAFIDPETGAYSFQGLRPGLWRFTVPGWGFSEYILDGVPVTEVPEAPFTSPIDVPPPGTPRSLDLPVSTSLPDRRPWSGLEILVGFSDQLAGLVQRAVGQPEVGMADRLEALEGVDVVVEIVETGEILEATTDSEGRFSVGVPVVEPQRTLRVTVEDALGGVFRALDPLPPPFTGDTAEFSMPSGAFAAVGFELPGRLSTLSGLTFYDDAPENGVFDAGETLVGGLTVALREVGQAVVRETTSAPDGSYAFEDCRDARWIVEASGAAASEPYARLIRVSASGQTSGDLPMQRPPCCTEGNLHAFQVKTAVWVGERDPHSYEVVARLSDGCGRRSRLLDQACAWFLAADGFAGDATGWNDVLSIADVHVEDGWAVVTLDLVASENLFPAGFFGDVERRVEVRVGGRRNVGCAPFTCAALRPGAWFTAGPDCVPPSCGDVPLLGPDALLAPPATCPDARFLVVGTEPYDAWRAANPPGPCLETSTDGAGDFQWVELEIDHWAKPRKDGWTVLDARILGGGRFRDRLTLRFQGDLWAGEEAGANGRLVVTRIERQAGDGWTVRVCLRAPDRADGNPGSLPAWWVGVQTKLNRSRRSAWLDLSAELEAGRVFGWAGDLLYELTGWRTSRDAAACR